MSYAGSFSGLQFRIMEVLENQPRQAPLTALEIADILHSGEYRNEMKDTVVFKVSRAVHGMKEQGKIVVSDARDKEGRLCYQLPQRLKFPPKVSANPANPVLTPENAAKVLTKQVAPPDNLPERERFEQPPKPAPTVAPKATPTGGKNKQRPLYVAGITDKITEALDKAPHPLTTADLARELGHLYGDNVPANRLTTLFSGNLHHLVKNKRTAFRRKVKGYGQGIVFEYFTRETGTEPHPLAPKKAAPKQIERPVEQPVVEAKPVVTAPLVSEQLATWAEPPVVEQQLRAALFRPQKPELRDIEVKFRAPAEWNTRLVDAAHRSGISVAEFIMQAVDFAIDHLDA